MQSNITLQSFAQFLLDIAAHVSINMPLTWAITLSSWLRSWQCINVKHTYILLLQAALQRQLSISYFSWQEDTSMLNLLL